jgi:hypothetical protein
MTIGLKNESFDEFHKCKLQKVIPKIIFECLKFVYLKVPKDKFNFQRRNLKRKRESDEKLLTQFEDLNFAL